MTGMDRVRSKHDYFFVVRDGRRRRLCNRAALSRNKVAIFSPQVKIKTLKQNDSSSRPPPHTHTRPQSVNHLDACDTPAQSGNTLVGLLLVELQEEVKGGGGGHKKQRRDEGKGAKLFLWTPRDVRAPVYLCCSEFGRFTMVAMEKLRRNNQAGTANLAAPTGQ